MIFKTIPIFIHEEHHEAFYIWHFAIREGFIPPSGNTLLHVDEHSDMSPGRFKYCIHLLKEDLEEIRRFTYHELTIDSFITTAIYGNIFQRVQWVRQKHEGGSGNNSAEMYVRSFNNGGKKLILARKPLADGHATFNDANLHYFTYHNLHVGYMRPYNNTVLDIDLDFFSCTGHPNKQKELHIEISEGEFYRFNNSPYHRMNYLFSRVETMAGSGKYYYVVNSYDEVFAEDTYVDEDTIRQRITLFVSVLRQQNITPQLINICRSRHSGFTPEEQWEFIETELCRQLGELYPLHFLSFNPLTD